MLVPRLVNISLVCRQISDPDSNRPVAATRPPSPSHLGMDSESYARHLRKLQADRLSRSRVTASASTTRNTLNLPPPPAYTPSATLQPSAPSQVAPSIDPRTNLDRRYSDDEEDEDEDDDELEHRLAWATNVTVTAPVKVVGHGNVLNTSSLMGMLGSSIAAALEQHQAQLRLQQQQQSSQIQTSDTPVEGNTERGRTPSGATRDILRPLKLNVSCGVSIVGNRNIVGESLARAAVVARGAVAGATRAPVDGEMSKGVKRKLDMAVEDALPPAAKKADSKE